MNKETVEFIDKISALQANWLNEAIILIDKYGKDRNESMKQIASSFSIGIDLASFTNYTPTERNEGVWISVDDRMPEPETEVVILAVRSNGYKVITTAMYENGKVSTEDSIWSWYDIDFDYDEENDVYLIPEGWWEYRHYNPDDVLNNAVDDKVTHWMPLPEAPKGSDTNG